MVVDEAKSLVVCGSPILVAMYVYIYIYIEIDIDNIYIYTYIDILCI